MREKGEDRLSQLPSSVALYIPSFLSMKDAARTSALSRYWRRRWLFADLFDFDTNRVFNDPDSIYSKISKYVEWVNNVLRSHREATDDDGSPLVLNKLRIHTLFQQIPEDQLDEWLSYAFARRVQSLELHCVAKCPFSGRIFPDGTDFNCLRSLSLERVNVTEQVVESFLRKFRFLERLKVCSASLKTLTVCGSSLALKHLELSYCYLDLLVVRDTSLVSLSVNSMDKLVLVNNPKLVAVRAVVWRSISRNILEHLSGCLPTVQILALDTTYKDSLEAIDKVPQLSEVKQLTLIVDPLLEDSLIRLAALLSLSPKLEKLVLEFLYVYRSYPEKKMALSTVSTRFCAQQRVKVVEVRGYYGDEAEDEALLYVLHNAVAPPGRVIFDPRHLRDYALYPPRNSRASEEIRTNAEKRVELLKRVLPSSVQLVVV